MRVNTRYINWRVCSYYVSPTSEDIKPLIIINILVAEDVPVVEFMYLVFTRMPGDGYSRRLRSWLFVCVTDVFER